MTVWSLTPFFNELDVLEVRLGTLEDVVDRHVLAEATVTHAGDPKPLFFGQNRNRYTRWLDRIVHVVVDDLPAGADQASCWRRERAQREALARGLAGLYGDDLVLLSDVDEVPRPDVVAAAAAHEIEVPCVLLMPMHLYYVDWRWDEIEWNFNIARLVRGRTLLELGPEAVRQAAYPLYGDWPDACGWHLAYLGGVAAIQAKITAIAEREYARPEFLDPAHLEACLRTGRDLYGREHRRCRPVPEHALPPYVLERRAELAHLFSGGLPEVAVA